MLDERIEFSSDGKSRWAGMGNYVLVSPDAKQEIALRYAGKPLHGDSFHELEVGGAKLPGLVWGCNFAFTADSRFCAASWMAKRYERRTIAIDVPGRRYFVLPVYVHDFTFHWPTLTGVGTDAGLRFEFDGAEVWTPF
jgi:hypothetical protein